MYWLLREDVAAAMALAVRAGRGPSAAECAAWSEKQTAEEASADRPRNLTIAGDVAEIRITGILTQKPDFFAYWFGGGNNTTYEQIQKAFAMAHADAGVRKIQLLIDSPGGEVNGLFESLAAVEACASAKPISVRASQACSAAYAFAAVAGKIEATTDASQFGSIGVAATFWVFDEQVTITSTEAPDKRPDLKTEEGRAVVRKYLDDVHQVFADVIATGRGTTVEKVNADFGRGATLLAGEAKKRGLIDKIAKAAASAVRSFTETQSQSASDEEEAQPEAQAMDLETLRKNHPAVYDAAFKAGMTSERDRVVAHLTMGKASGDMKTAVEAIETGAEMTQTLNAKYLAAGMNRSQTQARQQDSDGAGAAADGARAPEPTNTLVDTFANDLPAKK